MGKDPRFSKTLWTNVIALIIGLVAFFSDAPLITENFPAIAGVLVTLVPILNMILRAVTSEPLTLFRR